MLFVRPDDKNKPIHKNLGLNSLDHLGAIFAVQRNYNQLINIAIKEKYNLSTGRHTCRYSCAMSCCHNLLQTAMIYL